ncbi:flagellar hook-basal body protein [bacterium]|nr:flagellar hook-basal body protein [bacterium]
MDRGTYSAASAGMLQLRKLELVNNNLANLSTPGFKGQYLISRQAEFEDSLASAIDSTAPFARADQERTPGVKTVASATDFSIGPIERTGNPLHAALRNPNEFFVINSPEGPVYTRAGNFTLDAEGRFITQDGFPVQGDGGELIVGQGIPEISSGGIITVSGLPGGINQSAGRLRVVQFDDPSGLERIGSNRFRLPGGGDAPNPVPIPTVVPGSLEQANVSAVQAIVELISASRGFELYTKSAQSIDAMNQSAIQRLGGRA